jgi:23S rRNA pseudouridine1911/1915/1917 synthase
LTNNLTKLVLIVDEEPQFLAVSKSAGIQTQAALGIPSLQSILRESIKQRDGHEGTPFVGLPHRLDRATSGVVLVARNQRALKRFNLQFQTRKIGKYYLAVLEQSQGPIAQASNEKAAAPWEHWQDYIRKVPNEARAEICDHSDGRDASLRIQIVQRHQSLQLALIQLETGRMHQIRVQASHRGCPVHGDVLYGGSESRLQLELPPAIELREPPLALHALRIEYHHPIDGKRRASTAPLPSYWGDALPKEIFGAAEDLVARSLSSKQESW